MMHQFSIRTLLLITTLVAICVGLFACARSFYAANAEVRAAELRSINSIVGMFGPGEIVVSEPGGSYAFDGSMIHLHDNGSPGVRFYGRDAYQRVTNIHFRGNVDPLVLDYLPDFRDLRSVSFSSIVTVDGEFPPRFSDLLSAIIDFRDASPGVSVTIECTDPYGKVLFEDP